MQASSRCSRPVRTNHLAELAHHYSRSDNTRKAVEYLGARRPAGAQPVRSLRSGHPAFQGFGVAQASARRRRTGAPGTVSAIPSGPRSLASATGSAAAELEPAVCESARSCARKSTTLLSLPCSFMENGIVGGRWSYEPLWNSPRASGLAEDVKDPAMLLVARTLHAALPDLGELLSRMSTWRRRWPVFDLRQPLPRSWDFGG